jgi:hypothetical protein
MKGGLLLHKAITWLFAGLMSDDIPLLKMLLILFRSINFSKLVQSSEILSGFAGDALGEL